MKKGIIVSVIVIIVVIFGYWLSKQGTSNLPKEETKEVSVQNSVAGFDHVPTPDELKVTMQKAGLDMLSAEGTVMHIHQHLDIMINGKNVPIPADIGIGNTFISPLHIHDTTGVLHVESPVQKDFTLGQFFDEWNVKLDNTCIAQYCADDTHKLVAAVNGKQIDNARDYKLQAHDEIELWYGDKSENPTFITSYAFPLGE